MNGNQEYSGSLAAFGDPVLDALVSAGKAIKETKKVRPAKPPEPSRCPSCGNVRILTRVHYAMLCQECHEDIDRLVKERPW